jgi:diacylglycerol kinase
MAVVVLFVSFFIGTFDVLRWLLIIFCIVLVIATEMINTSIENLAKTITKNYDPNVGLALDIASGAVLFVSAAAAIIGTILFVEAILTLNIF